MPTIWWCGKPFAVMCSVITGPCDPCNKQLVATNMTFPPSACGLGGLQLIGPPPHFANTRPSSASANIVWVTRSHSEVAVVGPFDGLRDQALRLHLAIHLAKDQPTDSACSIKPVLCRHRSLASDLRLACQLNSSQHGLTPSSRIESSGWRLVRGSTNSVEV